ncbi:MAG: redox-regulated ATPase YchF [Phycisphaeraceae bacterium]|nr:MAG: redox-regulated ATPase YchF [Phycisphaeraceae bacterium]
MRAGIIGLPYVGKTALFNALTGLHAGDSAGAAGRPNVGVAHIPDPRLDLIATFIPTKKIIRATLELVDIAGLSRGASEGKGMGNKFLTHIREVDAMCHVVRCFDSADVPHIDGSINPARDMETVETELILADLQVVEGALPRAERSARSKDPKAVVRLAVLSKIAPVLEDGRPVRAMIAAGEISDPAEQASLRELGMLTAKKVLYVANVDDDDLEGAGEHASAVRARAEAEGQEFVPVCAKLEAELAEMDEADRREMLEGLGMTEPALPRLGAALNRLLGLQSFYTAGPKEVRAWTTYAGATAPKAAGSVHSDIERGFIRAEIYSVDDLAEYKSEKAIREKGRMRTEGKSYIMQDGDVCHFLFNV